MAEDETEGRKHKGYGGSTATIPTVHLSCVRCRLQTSGVRLNCPSCEQVLVTLQSTSRGGGDIYILPPFTAPRLLRCSCCKEVLPQFCFTVRSNEKSAYREYRANQCRACAAFRSRVRREQRGDEIKERDRTRMGQYWQDKKSEGVAPPRATKAANDAALKRYRARKAGKPVPKQRPGKAPIHLKEVCRIADECPLREFCTVEAKGLA